MDPPRLKDGNHVGSDALLARKLEVLGSEKREGDRPVSFLPWGNPNPISYRGTCEDPREGL